MARIFKMGILGFGSMGKTHSYSVLSVPYYYPGCEFSGEYVSVCTSKKETAIRAAEQFGIINATDSEDDIIYDSNIDIIDICTPNIYHFETAKKAILSGKHVLCEKPLAVNTEQANELAYLAHKAFSENGQVCGMVFNNRHLASVRRAKELIDDGHIGRILSFDFKYLHNSCIDPERTVGWKQNADVCGAGTLFDLGAHAVDMCRYLCGDFQSIYSKEQIAFPEHKRADGSIWKTNADEAAYMVATLKCGAVGTVTVGKINVGENDGLSFAIYGTDGSLKFDLMEPDWLYFYDSNVDGGSFGGMRGFTKIECVGRYPAPGGKFPSPKAPNGWIRGHIGSMYAFFEAVYNGYQAVPSFEDGAAVQAILEAAHKSSLLGKEVCV